MFLQHGIGGSSDFFVIFGPQQALGIESKIKNTFIFFKEYGYIIFIYFFAAFQLADAGYDVWLGNIRGNTYNRIHEKYGTEDARFWAYG